MGKHEYVPNYGTLDCDKVVWCETTTIYHQGIAASGTSVPGITFKVKGRLFPVTVQMSSSEQATTWCNRILEAKNYNE